MKAYAKFKKTDRGALVSANYTGADFSPYHHDGPIRMTIFGCGDSGDFRVLMNPLEAHRLIGQLNDALQAHAKYMLAKG